MEKKPLALVATLKLDMGTTVEFESLIQNTRRIGDQTKGDLFYRAQTDLDDQGNRFIELRVFEERKEDDKDYQEYLRLQKIFG